MTMSIGTRGPRKKSPTPGCCGWPVGDWARIVCAKLKSIIPTKWAVNLRKPMRLASVMNEQNEQREQPRGREGKFILNPSSPISYPSCPEQGRGGLIQVMRNSFQKHAGDGGVEQRGHEADKQCTQTKARQIMAAFGCNRADAANLNADGSEVRKAGERESRKRVGTSRQEIRLGFPSLHHEVGVIFIDGKLRAQQAANFRNVRRFDAHEKCRRRKNPAKDFCRSEERRVGKECRSRWS